jgi:hypothetical protein
MNCLALCVGVCACVCVCARERERARESKRERESERVSGLELSMVGMVGETSHVATTYALANESWPV